MNRRNALLGLGAIATGGGALFGSGAFSQVQAERTVDVTLAGDANAVVELDPVNTTVAQSSNGVLNLDFARSSNGLNYEAVTEFTDVFSIKNNGDSSVSVVFAPGNSGVQQGSLIVQDTDNRFFNNVSSGSTTSPGTSDPIFEFYKNDSSGGTIPTNANTNGICASTSNDDNADGTGTGDPAAFTLNSGERNYIQARIDTVGVDSSIATAGNDLLGEITITAN